MNAKKEKKPTSRNSECMYLNKDHVLKNKGKKINKITTYITEQHKSFECNVLINMF